MTGGCHAVATMSDDVILPEWPVGTVAILVTGGDRPHAIPVSAIVRAGPRLAHPRAGPQPRVAGSPARVAGGDGRDLRAATWRSASTAAPACSTSICWSGSPAVAVDVEAIHDHDRPTFAIHAGVAWEWTDEEAARRDAEVQPALRAWSRTP